MKKVPLRHFFVGKVFQHVISKMQSKHQADQDQLEMKPEKIPIWEKLPVFSPSTGTTNF